MGSRCTSCPSSSPGPVRARLVRHLFCLAFLAWAVAGGVAFAQQEEPIGRFAVDARLVLPKLKQLPELAAAYSVAEADLPTWGKGVEVAAHYYPFSWRWMTFGVGGSGLIAQAHSGLSQVDGYVTGKVVDVRHTSALSHVSVNFGRKGGWSYISGGVGVAAMGMTTRAEPVDTTSQRQVIHYGAGARWYGRDHIGLTIDLRLHKVAAQAGTDVVKPAPVMSVFVASVGVTFK